jgi:post-segregation antitoxin (ccd killing protein)
MESAASRPLSEPFRFSCDIETELLEQLRRLGGDPGTHISVALRQYIRDRKGEPLAFEDLNGRLALPATEVNWIVPEDLRSVFSWTDPKTSTFIRAAIRRYIVVNRAALLKRTGVVTAWKPPERPTLEITIPRELWERVKALGGPIGKLVEQSVREFLRRRGTFTPAQVENASKMFGDYDGNGFVTDLVWQVPEDLQGVTESMVRAALRLCPSRREVVKAENPDA